jgi:glycosyltransferase involved in cell wall biosynthesis
MDRVQLVLPVHNEAASIERTVSELHEVLSRIVDLEFVVCEDGSVDGTKDVLRKLATRFPMKLEIASERKGYSRAVIDGFRITTAPYVLFVDSDGQCDPLDFEKLWNVRNEADVIIGWRVSRSDHWIRKLMSGSFKVVHRMLFNVRIHDPSCPYLLIPQHVLRRLVPQLGVLSYGFWWEFVARVWGNGFSLKEVPVRHRNRAAGETQVYRVSKVPGIAISHLVGLFTIRRQLNTIRRN